MCVQPAKSQSYQDLWIGGSIYSIKDNGDEQRYGMFKNLLYIDKDSITNINLRSASVEDSLFRYTHQYELRNQKFYRNVELLDVVNELESVKTDSLILKMPDNPFYFIYRRAERYEKATQKEALYQNLIKNNFTIQCDIFERYYNNDFEIQFSPTGLFYTDQLAPYISKSPYWFTTTFKGELFLILGKSNFFIQIHFFDKEAIYGTLHPHNELIQLNRIAPAKPEIKQQFIGKWKKETTDNTEELLILTEYEAQHIRNDEIISSTWQITQKGEMLIFPELWEDEQERQWKVQNIDKNTMTIEKNGAARKTTTVYKYTRVE